MKKKAKASVIQLFSKQPGKGKKTAPVKIDCCSHIHLGEEWFSIAIVDGIYHLGYVCKNCSDDSGLMVHEIPTPGINIDAKKWPPTFFLRAVLGIIEECWLNTLREGNG